MEELLAVLLVEDDEFDTSLTLAHLEQLRLANPVVVTRDGAEAMDYLLCQGGYAQRPSVDPVVVLLDLKLPKLDGLEVLRQIRAHSRLGQLPVVILTASRSEQDWLTSRKLGISGFIVKPVSADKFRQAMLDIRLAWGLTPDAPAQP